MSKTLYAVIVSALLFLGLGIYIRPVHGQSKQKGDRDAVSAILEAHAGKRFVPGEIIVKRKPGAPVRFTAEQVGPLGVEAVERTTSGGETVYRIPAGTMTALSAEAQRDRTLTAATALQAMPDVLYAQPNYIYRIQDTTPNDARYREQWHYSKNGTGTGNSPGGIGLPLVWDVTKGSTSVVVAVIDTGILPNHPDIVGSPNLVPGFDMISDTFMANDGNGRDPDPTDPGDAINTGECGGGFPPFPQPNSWHGTHVAGTIGVGNTNNGIGVAGVNWNVKVEPIRVLGKCGGTTADIADAIRWAAGMPVPGVPNNANKALVINMSLGGEGACSNDPVEQSAINDALAQGVTVVVAAGNSAEDASLSTPAGCNGVITVAASDFRGNLVTRYSNFGPTVEIMAPGGDIQRDDNGDGNPDGVLSMVSPADGSYAYYNGTSMASPHVAGVAALLLSCEPTLTPAQVLARLQSTALSRTPAQCPNGCGAGLLNAAAAIGTCGNHPPLPSVALIPSDLSLHPNGDHKAIVATVTQGGAPKAGETVTFSSDNTSVATVSPASAVTDSSGRAQATVASQNKGDTQVRASGAGASAQSHVKVPLLSSWLLLLLFGGAVAVYLRRLHQEKRSRG
jgi:serine protease